MTLNDVSDLMRRREDAQTTVSADLVVIPVEQLKSMYERFLRLNRLGQASVEEWANMPVDVRHLRHAIFQQSDFGAVYAGQFLPKEIRDAVRECIRAEAKQPEKTT